jgi:hypothetical protein
MKDTEEHDETVQAVLNAQKGIQLRGFSPRANYTDRATAACRRS